MPTIRNDRNGRWQGTVKLDGRIVKTKLFGTGRKGGPEWRMAVAWEEATKREILAGPPTPTDSVTTLALGIRYLDHVKMRYSAKTYDEKRRALRNLGKHLGNVPLGEITPGVALEFLDTIHKERSAAVANRARKNLSASWEWGRKFMDNFPATPNPFMAVDKYPEEPEVRYVPPEADWWQVFETSEGQDRVMLAMMYYTAARRGEVFQLTWSAVDLEGNRVLLSTRKTRGSALRRDWLPILPELHEALEWWHSHRPYRVDNVFMMLDDTIHCYHQPGAPYKHRQKFMARLCKRAGIERPFGFHAIRHRRAVDLYKQGARLRDIQLWLRHESAATTERYLKGCGVDLDQLLEAATKIEGPAKVLSFANKRTPDVDASGVRV